MSLLVAQEVFNGAWETARGGNGAVRGSKSLRILERELEHE